MWLIILSPFILRNRFLKLDKKYRYLIFFLGIYPIILPVYFFDRIYGQISFAFNVFVVIGNSIQYENWSMEITYSFYLVIIFPIVFFSTIINYQKKKLIYIINCIICLILIIFGFLFNFTLLAQSTSFEYLFITPYFVFLVLSVIIIIRFNFTENKDNNIKEEEELEEILEK